jgi:hypothetical protein
VSDVVTAAAKRRSPSCALGLDVELRRQLTVEGGTALAFTLSPSGAVIP